MNILIVEDENNIRQGLKKLINKISPLSSVKTCMNGLEALKLCEYNSFDLIFTDIKMPSMNGLDLIDNINNKVKYLVIISGYKDFDYAQRAITKGVMDYILKPISPKKIKQIINDVKIKINQEIKEYLKEYLFSYDVISMDRRKYLIEKIKREKYYFVFCSNITNIDIATNKLNKVNNSVKDEEISIFTIEVKDKVLGVAFCSQKKILEIYKEDILLNLERNEYILGEICQDEEKLYDSFKNLEYAYKIDSNLIKVIKEYIHNNYMNNITLNDIAQVAYVHPTYISKIFKKQTDQNLTDYILEYRICKAKQLLSDNKYKIYEVAQLSGFKDSKYFGNVFKTVVGITPSEYRNKL